ncbi:putative dolichyl-phosphate beta-glucosyltransferase [Xylariaceae sp. FL0255]|nr:putative dolichyl-phosphate beta-glucosyltransferase [Xylariaceae sp. FL0255]
MEITLQLPHPLYLLLGAVVLLLTAYYAPFAILNIIAARPRAPFQSEKTYITTNPNDKQPVKRQLPCWYDRWLAEHHRDGGDDSGIEPAELAMSVVFPAYNEEERILSTLEEAVEYLNKNFSSSSSTPSPSTSKKSGNKSTNNQSNPTTGWEILIVNDGSKDRTVDVALDFARQHNLHDAVRVITLERNRGKGGAVTHGLRHVRGEYALFADADGASRFSDLGNLIEGCKHVSGSGSTKLGVAIGSRAHLVASEAVVKRSALRNFLMRSFHLVLKILTPPATSRLRDTQCGFKLFTRSALPHIVPFMHAEGWIFDIEMLMLAESAPGAPVRNSDGDVIGDSPGIKVAEIPITWHEVPGSKLNVMTDSVKMALGLAILRASWMLGVYRRRLT